MWSPPNLRASARQGGLVHVEDGASVTSSAVGGHLPAGGVEVVSRGR